MTTLIYPLIGAMLVGVAAWLYQRTHDIQVKGDMKLSSKTAVLFDFDGVMADSFVPMMQVFNKLAPQYGLNQVDLSCLESLKKQSAKTILVELGATRWTLIKLIPNMRALIGQQILQIPPFQPILDLVSELKAQGHSVGIVTSNAINNIERYLSHHGVEGVELIAQAGLFSKRKIFKRLVKKNPDAQLIFIGDEVRDGEAVCKLPITAIGVTWGYQNKSALEQGSFDYLADNYEQLVTILENERKDK